MSAPISALNSRFALEAHDHDGNLTASLPYRNCQYEQMLNASGQSLRVEIPFRGYSQVTQDNLYPGKHELWLYDRLVSQDFPVFAGPLVDATPSSGTGVVSCSAQDALYYLAKRILKSNRSYSATLCADMIVDLMNYVNGFHASSMTVSKITNNTGTHKQTLKAVDRNIIADLIDGISQIGDGTDYFFRHDGTNHVLKLYGGKIKPASALSNVLDYGGTLDNYSVQYNAAGIGNDYDVANSNGIVGNAVDATAQTDYDALYQVIDRGSNLSSGTSLNSSAATAIKAVARTKIIPALVTRALIPIKHFDFGSQFAVAIDDEYVQYDDLIRVVGWQNTISQGDKVTTVIYTKDTAEVA